MALHLLACLPHWGIGYQPSATPMPSPRSCRLCGPRISGTDGRLGRRAGQRPLGQQQDGPGQEAHGADEGTQIGPHQADQIAVRLHVRRHGGDAKATEPTKLSNVIRQDRSRGRQAKDPWHSSAQASRLDTRKHTEPDASGRQTGW